MRHRYSTEPGEAVRNRTYIRRIAAVVFVLLFASAGAIFLLTSHAAPTGNAMEPAVSETCDPGVNAAEYWIMDGHKYHALHAAQLLHGAIKSANLFYTVGGSTSPSSPLAHSQILADYTSYAQFSRDIANNAIDPTVHWVMYENEGWSATPADEQLQPLIYEQKFAQLAHANGFKVILAPAQDLVPGFNQIAFADGTTYAQAFVSYFAPVTARYADIWLVQAQPYEATSFRFTNSYFNLLQSAALAARSMNSHTLLFAGLSGADTTSTSNLYQDWVATRSLVAGYWLTLSPQQMAVADQFFKQLPPYAGSSGHTCTPVR